MPRAPNRLDLGLGQVPKDLNRVGFTIRHVPDEKNLGD